MYFLFLVVEPACLLGNNEFNKKKTVLFALISLCCSVDFKSIYIQHCFTELTHEFLQILEKTPSRLKRIRNWKVSPFCGMFF